MPAQRNKKMNLAILTSPLLITITKTLLILTAPIAFIAFLEFMKQYRKKRDKEIYG